MSSTTAAQAPSFEEYAAASWPTLYRSAYLLAGNHADAEDLAQQTLVKAHGAWANVSASDSVHAYVRRILTNTFLSSTRPRRRRLELLTGDVPEWGRASGGATSTTGVPGASDERAALWPHVRELPPQQRAVVVLRYFEQLSEAEIAETLGCSRGTVKSTAHRALKSLKVALEASDDQPRAQQSRKEA
ncbi:SigE family RNA polymerase sigma factor [Nocardioides perillae]|uniref:RNA polymerase sigma-70 factor (Sigma-E family) n=1 Tax=Nocardioides perillae TaxID=1119534 RepID=A0A7Y9UKU3_9ACTN|nr:SigE family RNA polymerase sigma factor [Nocardioides perillae]NYG53741.1 RNA polymerase sigma-70 factor (sigma-E family) [Nocardioides perillae]